MDWTQGVREAQSHKAEWPSLAQNPARRAGDSCERKNELGFVDAACCGRVVAGRKLLYHLGQDSTFKPRGFRQIGRLTRLLLPHCGLNPRAAPYFLVTIAKNVALIGRK